MTALRLTGCGNDVARPLNHKQTLCASEGRRYRYSSGTALR